MMTIEYHLSLLLTDKLVWLLFVFLMLLLVKINRSPLLRAQWRKVFARPQGMVSLALLLVFISVGLLDSIHFNYVQTHQGKVVATKVRSLLDRMLGDNGKDVEKTYSAPLALRSFIKSSYTNAAGQAVRGYAPLRFSGHHNWGSSRVQDISLRIFAALGLALLLMLLTVIVFLWTASLLYQFKFRTFVNQFVDGQTSVAWRSFILTLSLLLFFILAFLLLSQNYHVLGTNQIGQDIFYESLKSIRTGMLIGTFTTLFMLPFALVLGTVAGYFGGWVDDIIQYLYTTLSSIPGVLLISAFVLVLQVYITNHAALFPTLEQRADLRLLALCAILGLTGWSGLCRLLRAETLKLREQPYVLAANALGVKSMRIIFRHIMPNVMHIVLITLVLDFSGLVLAEAVLSYVGVGVDPTMMSWGNMINSSRLELAREPIVWWPLVSAMLFMFTFVLSANLFADVVRDAFDPRR